MKKRGLIILAAVLIVICFLNILIRGKTLTVSIDLYRSEGKTAADYTVDLEAGSEIAEIIKTELKEGKLLVTLHAKTSGKDFLRVADGEDGVTYRLIYVHPTGVITEDGVLGNCTGGITVPIAGFVWTAVLFLSIIRKYREDIKNSLYRYRNVTNIGLIIFLAFFLFSQALGIILYSGIIRVIESVLRSASMFSKLALPLAVILSIAATVSNIKLMRNEGRTWRNMLACILGIVICLASLFPEIWENALQWSDNSIIDVHNMRGAALYVTMFIENVIFIIVAYLECIIAGTIIMTVKAARHTPAYDKDYMLILGCRVASDGSLTPLLKGRADKALSFAEKQEKANGKKLIFVPSGGRGSDEPVSEGDAVAAYLESRGIEKERILVESKSATTEENFRFSNELIRAQAKVKEPKIAFATTNYHVFRSGLLAAHQKIETEGTGSRTKGYFSLNAFVREFIATLVSEKKIHFRVLGLLILLAAVMVVSVYFSNVL